MTLGRSSLRLRLTLLVLVAVLPALGLVLYSNLERRREGAQAIKTEALELALAASRIQAHHHGEASRFLSTLARAREVRRRDAAACTSLFSSILQTAYTYTFIAVATPEGRVFAHAPSKGRVPDFSDRPWFQGFREQPNGLAMARYQVDHVNGKPTIILVQPVLDDTNQQLAILAIGLTLEWMNHFITDFNPPPGATLSLFDRHGTILAHTPSPEEFVGKSMAGAEMVRAALAHGQGTATTPCLDGIPRTHGFVSLAPGPPHLYLAVGIPKKVAYAEAAPELARNLAWLGLAGTLALLAAWFGGSIVIVRPVKRLADAAERLASGEMTARFGPSSGTDELGQLARTFDRMADSLQQRQEERDRAEEALRQSEETLRLVYEQCPMGMALIDYNKFHIIDPNPQLCHFLGYSREELPRTPCDAWVHPEDLERCWEMDQALAIGEKDLIQVDKRYIHKEGRVVWGHLTACLIRDAHDRPLCGLLMVEDITPRKEAEEALEASQRTYLDLFERAVEGIYQLTPQGDLLRGNPALAEIYGYATPEAMLLDFNKKGPGPLRYDTPDRNREFLDLLEKNDSVANFESQIRCRDGETRWISENARLVRNAKGEPSHIEGFVEDIAKRKQAEEELKKGEALFSLLAENLEEVFWLGEVEKEGAWRLVYVNPAVEKLFGFTQEQAYASNAMWSQVMHEADCERVAQAMKEFPHSSKDYNIEYRIRLSDRSIRWIWGRGRVVYDTAGTHPHTVEIAQDISQRREMERRSVLNQKLESIGQLAAGIAHEINTPTQYVGDNTRFLQDAFKDMSELLKRYDPLLQSVKKDERFREIASEVDNAAQEMELEFLLEEIPKAIEQSLEGVERVSTIVQAMKRFSHPESEDKKPLDINAAIASTVTVARNEWKYVAELEMELDRHLPPVPCFPGDFNQVILNMVVNAAHAIVERGNEAGEKGRIFLSTRQDEGFAEIRIRDTGIGIPEEHFGKIFDPFFTTKEVGQGTGQGLAIIQDIVVQKHNGTIRFETEVGKGTEFIIRLPLKEESLAMEGA